MVNKKHFVLFVNFGLLLASATRASGQAPDSGLDFLEAPVPAVHSEILPTGESDSAVIDQSAQMCSCDRQLCGCGPGPCVCDPSVVFGPGECAHSAILIGAEFLYIRPHFSEAIAFASGRQALGLPSTFTTSGQELDFDYEPSFRGHIGYRFEGTGQTFLLSYWGFDGDVDVSGRPNPGGFLVDPFGNVAGGAINPLSLSILPSGDLISTRAEVEMDIVDADLIFPLIHRGPVKLLGIAGVRVASIDQYYESVVTFGGANFARGDFSVDFTGAGPHLGSHLVYALNGQGTLSAFAKTTGALLVGEYDTSFSNTTIFPPLRAVQSQSVTRTIPVLEAELGLGWQVLPNAKISAGWLFQSWFDLGTSGGTFGGLFNGADDSNIMSFDGLTLGAELSF